LEQVADDLVGQYARQGTSHRAVVEAMVRQYEERLSDESPGSHAATVPETARSRRFRILKAMSVGHADEKVSELVHASPSLVSEAARTLAASALHAYVAAAVLMPYQPFLAAAERWRYDVDALTSEFDVSYE